jgi:hypothetical protein
MYANDIVRRFGMKRPSNGDIKGILLVSEFEIFAKFSIIMPVTQHMKRIFCTTNTPKPERESTMTILDALILAMADKKRRKSKGQLVQAAAEILKHTEAGRGSATDAMRLAEMDTPMRSDGAIKKAVYRKRKNLLEEKFVEEEPEKQQALLPPVVLPPSSSIAILKAKLTPKKRLTSAQAHALRQETAMKVEHYNNTFKLACLEYKAEVAKAANAKAQGNKYQKKSPEDIAKAYSDANPTLKKALVGRTIRNYVDDGKAGSSPLKRGERGDIAIEYFKALCGALESYIKLAEQDSRAHNLRRPALTKLCNSVVMFKAGAQKRLKPCTLFERIMDATAATLNIGKPNPVEQR